MWKAAIQAIKTSDENWIQNNQREFSLFFAGENELPAGKLKKSALKHHYEERLFKIFLSRDYDGLSLSPAEAGKLIENASALSSSWGWLLAIGAGGAYFADYLNPGVARKYFLPKEALVAGSGKPDGSATSLNAGQYEISGSWRYCSGCEQASVITAVTQRAGHLIAFIIPKEQAGINRDWNAIGLELTCSHTVCMDQVKIPADHFFDLSSRPRPSAYPLSSFPFTGFAQLCFAPVILGITRGFLQELHQYLEGKEAVWKEFQAQRYMLVKTKQREMEHRIIELQFKLYKIAGISWENHLRGKEVMEKETGEIARTVAEYCYQAVAELLPILGMSVLDKNNPLQQRWRDLQTARQHTAFHHF